MANDHPRVTLEQVALASYVSVSTASMVLRGAPGPSEQTKHDVIAAAKKLGYRAHQGARSLRSGGKGSVGVIVDASIVFPNPYTPDLHYWRMFEAMIAGLSATGLPTTILSTSAPEDEPPLNVDAVFDMAEGTNRRPGFGVPFGTPRVILGYPEDDSDAIASVGHDHVKATREVFDSLVERGSRSPGLVLSMDRAYARHVRDAYLQWCLDKGMTPRVTELDIDRPREESIASVSRALAAGVDAIYALFGDVFAAVHGVALAGLIVEADVQLVVQAEGIIELNLHPRIRALSYMGTKSGQLVCELLIKSVHDPEPGHTWLPYRLIADD